MFNVQDCGHFYRFKHTRFWRDAYGQLMSNAFEFDLTKDEMARTFAAFKQAYDQMNPTPIKEEAAPAPVKKPRTRRKTTTAAE